jgi:hypothetical protein
LTKIYDMGLYNKSSLRRDVALRPWIVDRPQPSDPPPVMLGLPN